METATKTSPKAGSAAETGSWLQDRTFAGSLAALTAAQAREGAWNDEDIADDVATISYERALRAQLRVSQESSDLPAAPEQIPAYGGDQSIPNRHSNAAPAPKAAKTARFTVRLSEEEFSQLRERAAEAGMSVSCYMRSCTLEVETLRMQVKAALADLRNSTAHPAMREKVEKTGGFVVAIHRLLDCIRHIAPRRRPNLRLNPANPFAPIG